MLVLKFGGSSMADAERILASARIVQAAHALTPVTVVVSAMAGVTDTLLRVAALALADGASSPHADPTLADAGASGAGVANVADAAGGDGVGAFGGDEGGDVGWRDELARLETRHRQTFLAIGGWTPDVFASRWRALLAEADALPASGLAGASPAGQAALARFSGWGERLAVDLMAHALTVTGTLAQAFADEPVILSGPRHGDHHTPGADPARLATRAALAPRLALLVTRGGVPVLPGYIARDSAERVTTLGRNGSDYSAAVIAAALGAAALYLYSDVPGLYTADPRVVPDAALLPALTYAEAGEIAALGARALHPRTVEPTARWGIPLALRSSLTPDAPGTDILPDGVAFGAAAAYARHQPLSAGDAQARPERWVVAARLWDGRASTAFDGVARLSERGAGDLIEVSATRLPPWPTTDVGDAEDGCPSCIAEALSALEGGADIQPVHVWSTPRQLRIVVDAAVSAQAQRLLHAALARAAARHARDERAGEVVAARWRDVG